MYSDHHVRMSPVWWHSCSAVSITSSNIEQIRFFGRLRWSSFDSDDDCDRLWYESRRFFWCSGVSEWVLTLITVRIGVYPMYTFHLTGLNFQIFKHIPARHNFVGTVTTLIFGLDGLNFCKHKQPHTTTCVFVVSLLLCYSLPVYDRYHTCTFLSNFRFHPQPSRSLTRSLARSLNAIKCVCMNERCGWLEGIVRQSWKRTDRKHWICETER